MQFTEEQITAGAKWLAANVLHYKWDGLHEGSARARGFDPWYIGKYITFPNLRQGDVREAVRGLLSAMGADQQKTKL